MTIFSFKKKKYVLVVSICMVTMFILYQLYIFAAISSQIASPNEVKPIINVNELEDIKIGKLIAVKSSHDKFVNEYGMLRGVSKQKMHKYRPDGDNQFKCITLHQYIPFDKVNDDYCDCEDGTDEPSTSACSNGVFFCDVSKPAQQVASSRVNDGICDCCDGSDEWLSLRVLSQGSPRHFNRIYLDQCSNVCKADWL